MNLDYRATIIKVSNGYIIQLGMGDDAEMVVVAEGEREEAYTGAEVLFEVMQYFSMIGSKHDPVRLRVEVEDKKNKDDAYEDAYDHGLPLEDEIAGAAHD